ncbi:MAG TPA: N-acetylglucosamine-6-phosphate deacetylase [Bryobacteraceae bacterium]|jgi:N-acetylglucosamine-6-phosphate deacetylase|nr:N-acetylglucosamine-6-phosphate deacetylase [Bryobacteraceae bacterium]
MNCIGIETFGGTQVRVTFDDTISAVEPVRQSDGLYLSPGFIDLQVNGFLGVDFNDPECTPEQITRAIRALFATGVTRFYPTVITGSPAGMLDALRNLRSAKETLREGVAMDGFHVEGPHISPDDGPRGAHPRRWVRPPDIDEFHRWQEATGGQVRIVTLAPDWPQSLGYIEAITAAGVVASIGHTNATTQQLADAVSAGATLSTHLGNGAHAVMRRHPNYLWEQLAEDRLMADFIVDGIHLPPSFLKVALRAKTVARAVLVTDAAAPAGCPPGRYQLGEQAVVLTEDNRVMLVGQERLAGSALRMDRGVENLMRIAGLSLADAVSMATTNAARAGRVPARTLGLAPGERADLIQFSFNPADLSISIQSTYISGQRMY